MNPTTAPAFVLGLYLWMLFQVMLHEAAHLFAARLVGFSPFALTVGKGPLMFHGRIGALEVRFHWLPLFGMVKARPFLEGLWWRGAVFSGAGILVDAILLVVLLKLVGLKAGAPAADQSWQENGVLVMIVVYQALIVAGTLIPSQYTSEGAKLPNDGRQVLDYLTGRTSRALDAYRTQVRRYDPGFRIDDSWLMRGDVPMLGKFWLAEQDMLARRYREATDKYLAVIGQVDMHPAEKALILDRMACIAVVDGDARFLTEAEGWARRACELLPECRTARGTFGSILVERGRLVDGLALLMPLTSEDNERIDRTLASCYIAKALHFLGRPAEAGKWIETARSLGEFPAVRSRIESALFGEVAKA
jgi:hypothetical protein